MPLTPQQKSLPAPSLLQLHVLEGERCGWQQRLRLTGLLQLQLQLQLLRPLWSMPLLYLLLDSGLLLLLFMPQALPL